MAGSSGQSGAGQHDSGRPGAGQHGTDDTDTPLHTTLTVEDGHPAALRAARAMTTPRRSLASLPMAAAGSVLGGLSAAAARLRHAKPLHPTGRAYDARVRRAGTGDRYGAPWLDRPGEDRGLARLSRAVGLPGGVPDVLGLALTFDGPDGVRHDLLLASTGLGALGRFVLRPRRDPFASAYTSLLPYASSRGPLLLAAVPALGHPGPLPAFRLLVARLAGRWREFGSLDLSERAGPDPDPPVRFDPILHPLPGLAYYPALVRLREPAYAAARHGYRT